MGKEVRALGIVVVMVVAGFVALAFVTPTVSADSRIWTTDTDFNAAGATFSGTEVIGVGAAASVQLTRDSLNWQNQNPGTSPGLREGPGMAFSAADGVSVLFGGWSGSAYSAETWEYDFSTNTWSLITTSPTPPGRESPAMSYDSAAQLMVMFGGYDSSGLLSDTWEYNVVTNTWQETTPASSPPTLASSAMAYHVTAARHILTGWSTSSNTFVTWAYDATANTWASRAGGPSNRVDHAMAYHVERNRIVLFGGLGGVPPNLTPFSDTWEYNYASNSWTQIMTVTSPSARYGHSMTYDPALNSALLFGGTTGTAAFQNTFRYYSNQTGVGTWANLNTITSPPSRYYAGLAFDTTNNVGVLYGGRNLANELGDTWALSASYRASGEYTSSVLDSGYFNTDWQTIFWNLTTQPAGTSLKFQLAAANSDTGPFFYGGPDGLAGSYYTTPGEAIWVNLDNLRWLKFRAILETSDPAATSVLEDITINYIIPPADPYIVSTDPFHTQTGVPVTKVVRVVFSEPMDTTSLSWTFISGTAVTFTPVWSGGDTIADLTHPSEPFGENMVYRLQISASDTTSNPLVPNPVNPSIVNPWLFITEATPPTITLTNPADGELDVPLNAPIVVDFSEPMDTNPTVTTWTIAPDIALTATWSNGDARLTLGHSLDFTQCIDYTVQIAGEDKAGVPLAPGMVPNPWTFTTFCINPYITATQPTRLETGVVVTRNIIIDFNKPMLTTSVGVALLPDDVTGKSSTWSNGDRRLTVAHTGAFSGCTPYQVTVTGTDTTGNSLIPGPPGSPPNPWKFMTVCPNPFLLFTTPGDGESDVAVDQPIILGFSEAMNTGSVRYTISPTVTVITETWDPMNTMLTIDHIAFSQCERYTVTVTAGTDTSGLPLVPGLAPSPFVFDTVCTSPYVTSTDPANLETLVPLAQPVIVTFSEPMDPNSLFVGTSPVIATTPVWSNGNMTLTLNHPDFVDCTEYMFFVNAIGADGNPLILPSPTIGAPDPWTFTTFCLTVNPYIVLTDPADGDVDVPMLQPVVIDFSEPIDPNSFLVVSVPSISFGRTWTNGDTRVTLDHTTPFPPCAITRITISADDVAGNPLTNVTGSKPNPWTFTSVCLRAPAGLQIRRVFPATINLTWGAVGAADSYHVYESQNRFATFPSGWNQVTVTGTWFDAVGHLSDGLPHYYIVRAVSGADESPNSTMAAKIDLDIRFNPAGTNIRWFSLPHVSSYTRASDIATELTNANVGVVAKWDPATQRSLLYYYFRGRWRGIDFPISAGDGLYVGAVRDFHWYVTGTDRALTLQFAFNTPPRRNINWFSLGYTTSYQRASDLVLDIEGSLGGTANTKINEVAMWDAATQSVVRFYWTTTGWTGSDFTINPGDGLYFNVVSSFTWQQRLLTPEVP